MRAAGWRLVGSLGLSSRAPLSPSFVLLSLPQVLSGFISSWCLKGQVENNFCSLAYSAPVDATLLLSLVCVSQAVMARIPPVPLVRAVRPAGL